MFARRISAASMSLGSAPLYLTRTNHSVGARIASNREWGGRWFNGHHMLHGPPHARFMYWHQSTMARPSQMAIRSPRYKCPNQDNGLLAHLAGVDKSIRDD